MQRLLACALGIAGLIVVGACSLNPAGVIARGGADASLTPFAKRIGAGSSNLPQHVVVIIQENRSVDNLFQQLPGADTQTYGLNRKNQQIPLQPLALGAPPDPTHSHKAFATEFAKGKLNGFASETCGPHCGPNIAYSYVTPSDVAQYYAMAEEFAFADHNMQPNEGPSLPAHLYLLAGQSTSTPPWSISENPKTPKKKDAQNCLAPAGSTVEQINMSTSFPGTEGDLIFPCIDQTTILDELQSAGLTWRYYTPNLGSLWTAPCAIEHFYCASNPNVVVPETTVLTDIANNQLADVSYVVPREVNSDHPGKGITGGPAWVSAVVDAVGQSPYWSNTAIVVEWDDWGGWYDHYLFGTNGHPAFAPKDPYEYGLRVPLMVISPYAAGGGSGYISHTPRDSTSILHFIEDVYGLPSLGQLDSHTDDLFELFDFNESPIPFTPFAQPGDHSIQQYRMLPPDPTPVDDD